MNETQIGTIDIRGTQTPVRVTDRGVFLADFDGQTIDAGTYDGLVNKLSAATRKQAVKISLPVYCIEQHGPAGLPTVLRGIITGVHGANGNLLLRWDDGKSEQVYPYRADICKALTDEQYQELERLLSAVWLAEQKLRQYQVQLPGHNDDIGKEAARLMKEAEASA